MREQLSSSRTDTVRELCPGKWSAAAVKLSSAASFLSDWKQNKNWTSSCYQLAVKSRMPTAGFKLNFKIALKRSRHPVGHQQLRSVSCHQPAVSSSSHYADCVGSSQSLGKILAVSCHQPAVSSSSHYADCVGSSQSLGKI